MKLTMIAVATLGAVSFALIFLSQLDAERTPDSASTVEARGGQAQALSEVRTPPRPVAQEIPVVAPSPELEAEPERTPWEGDPWAAGVAAYERGDFALATEALEAAIENDENSPYRHYLLGLALRRLGRTEAAAAELERSLELAPGNVRALVNLARVHLDLDDAIHARQAVDLALENDLDDADAWNVLGRIELRVGNLQGAEAAFEKSLLRNDTHAWAWNNLGYVRIQQGRFEVARGPLYKAAHLRDDVAVFFNNLGVALERTGNGSGARLAYAKAASLEHAGAEENFARVDEILIARGEELPAAEEIALQLESMISSALSENQNETESVETQSEELVAAKER